MYLKKLYLYNKFWFLVIIFFIAGQLFINYKRGVVCSPFYHYGMYSEVIKPAAHYTITEVSVNGEMLAVKDFSPQEWDNIMQPVIKFYDQGKWNSSLWQKDIYRLMPFTDSLKFVNDITEAEFKKWYHHTLENITGKKIKSFRIDFTGYSFDGTSFIKSTNQPF